MNRLLDIAFSSLGLLVTAVFYPFAAFAIKLETHGPVIVKLDRVSAGKIIKVYKFRTMVENAHAMKPLLKNLNERRDGPFFKIKNDPRLTRVGKIIRKFRLDEFPQFFNVFKGELAMVGPRPHEPEEVIHYPEEYKHLLLAKSGLTGLSQVSGASGLPFLKELQLDSDYVKNKSLRLNLKIIAKTAAIIFFDPTAV
ncbi:MAG: Exopolysaccharide biosynthesis polyprenyl glycosylphosphotransferase [Candidatus Giovannonibacteria bacterium GW2011_GWB1_47_6b]|uniref:Exopolysaccharide biosynthesis polyprenyl glycosylphosphotransferase n=1 Tax=Candidatus Giovannonibacteria bacterium GW2011_GWB1_47_6b TaxID=1618655 RepID=A0A0G1W1F0_9BACT|nr:MAG: Exopolysaccharide biosynthesis polyprenyl glycosylphosphotransferase [Candidatus Giovannonibacteria bacterium GW2011_GWB1_47_6b]